MQRIYIYGKDIITSLWDGCQVFQKITIYMSDVIRFLVQYHPSAELSAGYETRTIWHANYIYLHNSPFAAQSVTACWLNTATLFLLLPGLWYSGSPLPGSVGVSPPLSCSTLKLPPPSAFLSTLRSLRSDICAGHPGRFVFFNPFFFSFSPAHVWLQDGFVSHLPPPVLVCRMGCRRGLFVLVWWTCCRLAWMKAIRPLFFVTTNSLSCASPILTAFRSRLDPLLCHALFS